MLYKKKSYHFIVFTLFLALLPFISLAQKEIYSVIEARADSLYRLHDQYLAKGQPDSAFYCLDLSVSLFKSYPDFNPLIKAKSLHSMGFMYMQRSRENSQYIEYIDGIPLELISAEQYLLEAIEIKKQLYPEANSSTGLSLNLLGLVYTSQNKYELAEHYFSEALSVFNKSVGPDHLYAGWVHNNLALLYYETKRLNKAIDAMLRAIAIKESDSTASDFDIAASYRSLTDIYMAAGNFGDAESSRLKIISLLLTTPDDGSLKYYWAMHNIGRTYQLLEDNKKSLLYFKTAIQGKRTLLDSMSGDIASSLLSLGNSYIELDSLQEALLAYQEAYRIFLSDTLKYQLEIAWCINNFGLIYMKQGFLKEATKHYEETLERKRKLLGTRNSDWYLTYLNLINIKIKERKLEEAESALLSSMDSIQSIGALQNLYYPFLNTLFDVYYLSGKPDLALPLIDTLIKMDYASITQVIGANPPYIVYRYLKKAEARLDQYFSLHRNANFRDSVFAQNSFNYILFHKGLLAGETNRWQNQLFSGKDYNALRDSISYCKFLLHERLTQKDPNQKTIDSLEEQITVLEFQLASSFHLLGNERNEIRWDDVALTLTPGEAAIEFVGYQLSNPFSQDSTFYLAMILRAGDSAPFMVPLCEERDLQKSLANISDFHPGGPDSSDQSNELDAYELVWKPLEPYLQDIRRVYYSPGGTINIIPLNSLNISDKIIAGDQYEMVRIHSIRDLVRQQILTDEPKTSALFGGIDYEADTAMMMVSADNQYVSTPDVGPDITDNPLALRGGEWNHLQGTIREITNIHELLLPHHWSVALYTDMDATEEQFKRLGDPLDAAASPHLIHISTHGFFFPDPSSGSTSTMASQDVAFKSADYPMIRSGLILAGGNYAWTHGHPYKPGMEDGILTAYEISQMDLSNTELVVLSACETGLGDIKGNEGVYGLQRAFKIAGVKNLIMSLWKVPDAATAELMISFYKHWLEDNMTIRQALYTAQKELRDDGFEPYYWAGWVLVE
jgi:CHAT domain-containing protein